MPPIEGQPPGPGGAGALAQPGPGTIPLATLIDFILQRTYHELSVLSELLPRKTDMERKIEIVQFASRTRQLFVRLLALVKWANSASKVDKCAAISSFLDKQAMLFVDTADMLAKVAHETRMSARLPAFSIPCAIDVLTTGTYPRLPTCVKERIVPADPISPIEKRETLQRLNQIIEYRLVTSDLPPQMKKLKIANGRVKFLVEHEFEVTLTLMGDGPSIPWRLLDIDILVEDHETGDGKALVHTLQVNYIHQLVQSRLLDNDRPLHDLYNCLHSFSQSLQLEVLHSQAERLRSQRLGDHIRVEEYTAGRSLVVSYWRLQVKRDTKPADQPPVYKLSIHVDEADPGKPLQVTHTPEIQGKESYRVAQAIKSDHLSIEKLLIQTIQVRSQARLRELEKDVKKFAGGPCEIKGVPPTLLVPVLFPCMDSEKMLISVDIQRGLFLTSMPQYGAKCKVADDIEESLNSGGRELARLMTELRIWLGIQRCEKSIQHLPAAAYSFIPLTQYAGHPIENLGPWKLYIKLLKQANFYVVVDIQAKGIKAIEYNYYLLQVEPCTFEKAENEIMDDIPTAYLRPKVITKFDTYAITHGPLAKIHDAEVDENEEESLERKRKILQGDVDGPPRKQARVAAYFVSELVHILAATEDRIPFVNLGQELQNRGIGHQGVQVDGNGSCYALTVVDIPCSADTEALKQDLLSCTFRVQGKTRSWHTELVFTNCPVMSTSPKEKSIIHRVVCMYELSHDGDASKLVQDFMDDWATLGHLYKAVLDFSIQYKNPSTHLHNMVEIKSYSYKRLVLGYGPSKLCSVNIQWSRDRTQFVLAFGTCGPSNTANPHTLVATQLQAEFNKHKSIATLAQTLHETWMPMAAICKLHTTPFMAQAPKAQAASVPQPNPLFSVIPQSSTHIRIGYRNTYCLDIHLRSNKMVSVRDGAYSWFDTSKVVEGFTPTPGLKTFLNHFVEEGVPSGMSRRRSTTEDDNPPSPVGMDSMETFMNQPQQIGSPVKKQDGGSGGGLRFPGPMTPPSNPHTPASPSGARLGQSGYSASPAAAFPLASPPSLQMGTPSPGNVLGVSSPGNPQLHVPSPGSFVPAPSPSSLGIHMPSPATAFISPQGMLEGGSPYHGGGLVTPSPGPRNWPGSPSPASRHGTAHSPGAGHQALHSPPNRDLVMSPPSRMLPQRSWAASIPTLLTHEALNKLLTPTSTPGQGPGLGFLPCCPLQRFLGCVFLKRSLQRIVQTDDALQHIPPTEPGVVMFKSDSMQFRVALNPNTQQVLQMKITPSIDQWSHDELQVLERFFEVRVTCPPYKLYAVTAFTKLLAAPPRILKDCVQLMRLELMPDRSFKWGVHWCLTSAASSSPIVAGAPAVLIKGNKMLFMIQLTRMSAPPTPGGSDQQSIVIPILYDINTNITSMVDQSRNQPQGSSPQAMAVMNMLKRFTEYHANSAECSIFPAVRELMANLILPV